MNQMVNLDNRDYDLIPWICDGVSVVPVSGEEDREPFQCGGTEAADHEWCQQSPGLALTTHISHEGQGIDFLISLTRLVDMPFDFVELMFI